MAENRQSGPGYNVPSTAKVNPSFFPSMVQPSKSGGGGRGQPAPSASPTVKYYVTPSGTITYRANNVPPPSGSQEISQSQYNEAGRYFVNTQSSKLPESFGSFAQEGELSAEKLAAIKEAEGNLNQDIEQSKVAERERRIQETLQHQQDLSVQEMGQKPVAQREMTQQKGDFISSYNKPYGEASKPRTTTTKPQQSSFINEKQLQYLGIPDMFVDMEKVAKSKNKSLIKSPETRTDFLNIYDQPYEGVSKPRTSFVAVGDVKMSLPIQGGELEQPSIFETSLFAFKPPFSDKIIPPFLTSGLKRAGMKKEVIEYATNPAYGIASYMKIKREKWIPFTQKFTAPMVSFAEDSAAAAVNPMYIQSKLRGEEPNAKDYLFVKEAKSAVRGIASMGTWIIENPIEARLTFGAFKIIGKGVEWAVPKAVATVGRKVSGKTAELWFQGGAVTTMVGSGIVEQIAEGKSLSESIAYGVGVGASLPLTGGGIKVWERGYNKLRPMVLESKLRMPIEFTERQLNLRVEQNTKAEPTRKWWFEVKEPKPINVDITTRRLIYSEPVPESSMFRERTITVTQKGKLDLAAAIKSYSKGEKADITTFLKLGKIKNVQMGDLVIVDKPSVTTTFFKGKPRIESLFTERAGYSYTRNVRVPEIDLWMSDQPINLKELYKHPAFPKVKYDFSLKYPGLYTQKDFYVRKPYTNQNEMITLNPKMLSSKELLQTKAHETLHWILDAKSLRYINWVKPPNKKMGKEINFIKSHLKYYGYTEGQIEHVGVEETFAKLYGERVFASADEIAYQNKKFPEMIKMLDFILNKEIRHTQISTGLKTQTVSVPATTINRGNVKVSDIIMDISPYSEQGVYGVISPIKRGLSVKKGGKPSGDEELVNQLLKKFNYEKELPSSKLKASKLYTSPLTNQEVVGVLATAKSNVDKSLTSILNIKNQLPVDVPLQKSQSFDFPQMQRGFDLKSLMVSFSPVAFSGGGRTKEQLSQMNKQFEIPQVQVFTREQSALFAQPDIHADRYGTSMVIPPKNEFPPSLGNNWGYSTPFDINQRINPKERTFVSYPVRQETANYPLITFIPFVPPRPDEIFEPKIDIPVPPDVKPPDEIIITVPDQQQTGWGGWGGWGGGFPIPNIPEPPRSRNFKWVSPMSLMQGGDFSFGFKPKRKYSYTSDLIANVLGEFAPTKSKGFMGSFNLYTGQERRYIPAMFRQRKKTRRRK